MWASEAAKVSLKLARERAAVVRSQVAAGIDPLFERRKSGGILTFREAAVEVHNEHKRGWKSGKHRASGLAFGDVAVSEVEAPAVRDALSTIWLRSSEKSAAPRRPPVLRNALLFSATA
jgi:hypothetical protein